MAQALRYSEWADAVGIALLNPTRSIDVAAERARDLGFGLAVYDRWLVRPTIGRPKPGKRMLASEILLQSMPSRSSDAD
jgi:hypothetical protein